MAKITNITTGEQTVNAAGAITGSLDTSGLSGSYMVKVRVSGLASANPQKTVNIALEDTANVTPFSDAAQLASFQFQGGMPIEGIYFERASYDLPAARFGAANTKFRLNCLSITAGGSVLVYGWLEQ